MEVSGLQFPLMDCSLSVLKWWALLTRHADDMFKKDTDRVTTPHSDDMFKKDTDRVTLLLMGVPSG